jgi:predicted Rossmann fold nucleotide-binding protein DprA/Smf involved in DNA uptake
MQKREWSLHLVVAQHWAGQLWAIGNSRELSTSKTGLLCSSQCPASLIVAMHDLALSWGMIAKAVLSGFHSPVEKECLRVLLRGKGQVIICPARGIGGMRIPVTWRGPLEDGRLLILSPFEAKHRRLTVKFAQRRNEFVAALADEVFVIHASPGGKLEALAKEIVTSDKPCYTFESEHNKNLLGFGFQPINKVPLKGTEEG